MKNTLLPIVVTLAVLASACSESEPSSVEKVTDSSATELSSLFVEAEPDGAISVIEAKTATPGETITVTGKIAGSMQPFTEGYALVVLADDTLETCDLIPGDECPTPWDACCETPETIKASRITIQAIGGDGRPLAESLEGVNDLKEMDPLPVTGVVDESSTAENLILNVSTLFKG